MGYDVTMDVSVRLEGPIETKTENQIYVEHLNMTVSVYIPNNVTRGTSMRLRGMGKSSPDGKKGDLYLKLISIDNDKVYSDIQYCGECGQKLTSDARFCHKCGTAVGRKMDDMKQRKQEWAGKIMKCPRCGEEIPSFVTECASCGYELRGTNPTNSVRELAAKLEQVSNDSMKANLIRTFPIPNTREDIIEFMILASTNIENSFQADISEAWSVKFEQAYEKTKVIYGDLPEVTRCYDLFLRKKKEINKIIKRRERNTKRKELAIERKNKPIRRDEKNDKRRERFADFITKNNELIVPILILGFFILVIGLLLLPHKFKEMELNKLVDEVEEYIEDGKYDKARVKPSKLLMIVIGHLKVKRNGILLENLCWRP